MSAYLFVLGASLLVASLISNGASAAPTGPLLGTAGSFGVLGGAGVTNTGSSVITGDLGTCPNPAITGFPPGTVNGATHANDAVACNAQADTTIAYNNAAGRAPTTTYGGPTELGGLSLGAGVYKTPSSFAVTGSLVLDGAGDPDATFIFQAGSTVITATNSAISMINGAQACNVYWQVGSSATLGVGTQFKGTILALTSITANTNTGVEGRLLARNGSVTLDANVVTRPACVTTSTTTAVPPTTAPGATTTTTMGASTTTAVPPTTAPGVTTTTTMGASTSTSTTTSTTTAVVPTTTSTTAPFAAVPPPSSGGTSESFDLGRVTVTPGVTPTATTLPRVTAGLPRTGSSPDALVLAGLGALILGALVRLLGARKVNGSVTAR